MTNPTKCAETSEEKSSSRIASFLSNAWLSVTGQLPPEDGGCEDEIIDDEDCLADSTSAQDIASLEDALRQFLFPTKQVARQFCLDAPTNLVHVKQKDLWDCGIACLQMVMAWLRPDGAESREWMLRTVGTESIWSIDLMYLLSTMIEEEDASYLLCSKTMGVDESHLALGYYQKAFSRDEVRVRKRFDQAACSGWPLLCIEHLGLAQVVRLVSRDDCIAIVLLDNSILRQRVGATYAGHYVILCGISFEQEHLKHADGKKSLYCMVIKNPARLAETTYVSPSRFEEAWRATGTDDDILFVAKK
jgi:Guanylylate cyclase